MSDERKDNLRPSERSTLHAPDPGFVDPLVGKRVAGFHIRRLIAAGGMGKVYEAIQDPPRRSVALKIMKPGIASRSAMRRFEFEAQTLARLRHPGIAQIYEAGTWDDGSGAVPYFAMEYISGAATIIEHADRLKLGTRQRLDLFARVCEAVDSGHQKAIIHRDLKPSNILVDATGQPKVIDFGLARATDSDMAVTSLQTDFGDIMGTLPYMAPEQFDPDPHDLDTRADSRLSDSTCPALPRARDAIRQFQVMQCVDDRGSTHTAAASEFAHAGCGVCILAQCNQDCRSQVTSKIRTECKFLIMTDDPGSRTKCIVLRLHWFDPEIPSS